MTRILEIFFHQSNRRLEYHGTCRHPQPPLGFVRRSDPNFYFLMRKY